GCRKMAIRNSRSSFIETSRFIAIRQWPHSCLLSAYQRFMQQRPCVPSPRRGYTVGENVALCRLEGIRMRLQDKVVIVTGAATGIGRAIALRMAAEGAAVTVDYIGRSDNADQVVRQISDNGGRAMAIRADVRQPDQVEALVAQTVSQFGHLDIL